jgi:hypothetical protein
MNSKTLAQNLLMAYVCAKAANECLQMVYEFREKVDNKDFIDAIKQVKPKINYFTKMIDRTLLSDTELKTSHWDEIQERAMVILDDLDKEIKTL